jgi:hypothetical protein
MASIKCIIYDFDGTLFGESLFSEGERILKIMSDLGIKQSMATFNRCAPFYIKRYDIGQYFDKVCFGKQKDHKLGFLRSIIKHYNLNEVPLKEDEVLFIDDDPDNIIAIQEHTKIHCIQVDPKIGITFGVLREFVPSLYK